MSQTNLLQKIAIASIICAVGGIGLPVNKAIAASASITTSKPLAGLPVTKEDITVTSDSINSSDLINYQEKDLKLGVNEVSSLGFSVLSDIPDIELGGVKYEIDFKFSVFDTENLDPELQALIEAQPWFTGTFSGYSLALDAASQVYECGGFIGSSCTIPFDEFGSVNSPFGGTSPWFIYDHPFTQLNAAAVGFPSIADNELSIPAIAGNRASLHYAVAIPKDVPEPTSIFSFLVVGVAAIGTALKRKKA